MPNLNSEADKALRDLLNLRGEVNKAMPLPDLLLSQGKLNETLPDLLNHKGKFDKARSNLL